MKIYSIYKLTNIINNKGYIGFTSQNPEIRFKKHLKNAKKKYNQYLYDAINKYGWENFTKEIIYQSKDGEYTLKEMEPHFIKEYNTFYMNGSGYNMTFGGDGIIGHKHTEEFKKKRSKKYTGENNPFFGKHQTEENKAKISKAVKKTRHLRIGELAPSFGKKHTEETKKQIGDTLSEYWIITFPDGHIEEIKNLRLFCREHKLNSSTMCAVAIGKQHQHKGYKCQSSDCKMK